MSDFKINIGEKYAAVALQSDRDRQLSSRMWPNGIWTTRKPFIYFDDHWREWLGSIRTEHFDSSNFFIVVKKSSQTPDILDQENRELSKLATNFYLGLLLAGRIPIYEKPLLITGGMTEKSASIRQLTDINCPIEFSGIDQDPLNQNVLTLASRIGDEIPHFWAVRDRYKRFRRVMNIYFSARTTTDILDRLHQYTRCVEGFIIPSAGQTARKFQSRTELFIGPSHHQLMKDIFEVRSAIEHMNDHLNMISTNREDRAQIYRWATIIEYIARDCIVRVIESTALRRYFETDEELLDFWKLSAQHRRELWGPPIDPLEAIGSFNQRLISNSELGLPVG